MIPVQNIYYMLSYAFQILNEQGYKDIATEQFDNVAELCAAILSKGITVQLKRGLGKEYIPQTEALSSLRGKIDITEAIKTQSLLKKQLICTYDDFTVNSYLNRILKSTMGVLLHADISKARKKALRKLMIYFADVDVLDVHTIQYPIRIPRLDTEEVEVYIACLLLEDEMPDTVFAKVLETIREERRKDFMSFSLNSVPGTLDLAPTYRECYF